jgi:hypothetical protein
LNLTKQALPAPMIPVSLVNPGFIQIAGKFVVLCAVVYLWVLMTGTLIKLSVPNIPTVYADNHLPSPVDKPLIRLEHGRNARFSTNGRCPLSWRFTRKGGQNKEGCMAGRGGGKVAKEKSKKRKNKAGGIRCGPRLLFFALYFLQ